MKHTKAINTTTGEYSLRTTIDCDCGDLLSVSYKTPKSEIMDHPLVKCFGCGKGGLGFSNFGLHVATQHQKAREMELEVKTFTTDELIDTLVDDGKITKEQAEEHKKFINNDI